MAEQLEKTLTEAWMELLRQVMEHGRDVDDEIREVMAVTTHFTTGSEDLSLLARHGLDGTVPEMRKVFFSSEPNRFGHSYRPFWRGPCGKDDLSDVIALLREQPSTKRALLAFVDPVGKRVPCLNLIHFLVRDERLEVAYFARGQDIYLKFCADALCVFKFGAQVAEGIGVPLGSFAGTISSAHVYRKDFARVEAILGGGRE